MLFALIFIGVGIVLTVVLIAYMLLTGNMIEGPCIPLKNDGTGLFVLMYLAQLALALFVLVMCVFMFLRTISFATLNHTAPKAAQPQTGLILTGHRGFSMGMYELNRVVDIRLAERRRTWKIHHFSIERIG